MRYSEIIGEALAPDNKVTVITDVDTDEAYVMIGGRIIKSLGTLGTYGQKLNYTIKNTNLKNLRPSGKGPLLYHGTGLKFDDFAGYTWLSSEPITPTFHAEFTANRYKDIKHKDAGAVIMVCEVTYTNPFYDPPIVPGQETYEDLKSIYDQGYDAIIWRNTRDANAFDQADLYNIPSNSQIKVRGRLEMVTRDMDTFEIEELIAKSKSGATPKSKPIDKKFSHKVIDPGLSPLEKGDYITPDQYKEYEDFIKAARIR